MKKENYIDGDKFTFDVNAYLADRTDTKLQAVILHFDTLARHVINSYLRGIKNWDYQLGEWDDIHAYCMIKMVNALQKNYDPDKTGTYTSDKTNPFKYFTTVSRFAMMQYCREAKAHYARLYSLVDEISHAGPSYFKSRPDIVGTSPFPARKKHTKNQY